MFRKFLLFLLSINTVAVFPHDLPDSVSKKIVEAVKKTSIEQYQDKVVGLWLNYPDSAMLVAREALAWSEINNDLRSKAVAVRLIGGVHNYKGSFDSALYYSKWAYQLTLQSGDSINLTSALNNLGLSYYNVGSYANALENLLRAYNMKIKIFQTYGLGLTLNNIGLVYFKLKDYTKAREYFIMALEVSEKLKDLNIALYSENNIGFTYLKEKAIADAEHHFNKALALKNKVNNINWEATTQKGLGEVSLARKEYAEAERYFRESLRLKKQIDEQAGISEAYHLLSTIKFAYKQLDSAFYFLQKSQQYAYANGARDQLLDNYALFVQLYQSINRLDSALYFQNRYLQLRDSLINESLSLNISEIQLKLKEEESALIIQSKDLQIKQRTTITYFSIAISLVTVLFASILFRSYMVQKRLGLVLTKKNAEISNQKEEIETQKEALLSSNVELEKAHIRIRTQNQELERLNNQLKSTVDIRTQELEKANKELNLVNLELENFIYKSAHDIKGPLVRLIGICQVALLDVNDEKAREYLNRLNTSANQVNEIFDRLKMISELGNTEPKRELINFDRLISTVINRLKAVQGFAEIKIYYEVEPTLHVYSDTFLLDTIIYNMLENAIRFRKERNNESNFCKIQVGRVKNNLIINFTDNGIGIKESNMEEIFTMFSAAALEYQNVGLGLYTVKQCVVKLGGKVDLIRGNQEYTEFEVSLPIQY